MISTIPAPARLLGFAGLLPQLIAAMVIVFGGDAYRFAALAIAFSYASLILSFLGGMWWGLAARADAPPAWLWGVAVAPTLLALLTFLPWLLGSEWPGPSLVILGVAIMLSPLIDRRLGANVTVPLWWMALRWPLSIGLGGLSLLIGLLA